MVIGQFRQCLVVGVVPVKGIEHTQQSHLSAALTEDSYDTYVLQSYGRRDDIQVGVAQLMARQSIGVLFILGAQTVRIANGLASR